MLIVANGRKREINVFFLPLNGFQNFFIPAANKYLYIGSDMSVLLNLLNVLG